MKQLDSIYRTLKRELADDATVDLYDDYVAVYPTPHNFGVVKQGVFYWLRALDCETITHTDYTEDQINVSLRKPFEAPRTTDPGVEDYQPRVI